MGMLHGLRVFSAFLIYVDFIIWPFYNCIAWKTWFREHHLSVVFIEIGHHRADCGLLMSATEIQLPCFISEPSAAWGMCVLRQVKKFWE